MPSLNRRRSLQLAVGVTASSWTALARVGRAATSAAPVGTRVFFANLPDRIWLGAEFWANPMEDWRIKSGRLECTNTAGDRNVHLLTHSLSDRRDPFSMSVRTGVLRQGKLGGTGFRLGDHDLVNDYRGNCLWGQGIGVGLANGRLVVGSQSRPADASTDMKDLLLHLEAKPVGDQYELTLRASEAGGKSLGTLTHRVPADRLVGNVALVNNLSPQTQDGSSFWYDNWQLAGDKFDISGNRMFGPILWTMHTLSNTRSADGYELKLSVQMPPLGDGDQRTVALDFQRGGQWSEAEVKPLNEDTRMALFTFANWDESADVPYRVRWTQRYTDGERKEHTYEGTIRQEPKDRPLVLAGMTCQQHQGFPYGPVADNLAKLDPDVLFFSGDQIYEENGHYGITRTPAEAAILSYLRKWYLFGWVFGDVMRDRPTLCIPDDHDVFQANIWGEAGDPLLKGVGTAAHGGYIQPVRMIEVVHQTNTSHHPRLFDDEPVKRGISVYFGDMVYGRVSFAIVGDRQFKTGPEHARPGEQRPDWIPEGYDVATLDKPEFEMLGDRQEAFLEHWAADWRGCDLKVLLSETVWANVNTHHGKADQYLLADLDSGAWPQHARNKAVEIARKALPVHVSGDQHLSTLVQYGIDEYRDAFWSFCTPAVSVGYQRWWRPDEVEGRELEGPRPDHGMANTGHYRDGLGHPTYVYAVANPPGSQHPNRYERAELKASGFGIVRCDPAERTYTFECYRFNANVDEGLEQAQFKGWPMTVHQRNNDGRVVTGYLPTIDAPAGVSNPAVKVLRDGELIYSLRIRESSFTPWVFEDGTYTVEIGDPDTDAWTTHDNLQPSKSQ